MKAIMQQRLNSSIRDYNGICLDTKTNWTRGGSIYRKYRQYIADIDISVLVSYQHFRYRFFYLSTSYRWQV